MRFELFIAWKHLTRRRKAGFISLISMISVAGVSVGVMALIVVLGVMSGFDRELKAKIVNVQPHLRIESGGGIEDIGATMAKVRELGLSTIRSMTPFVEGQAILKSERNATGVVIKGFDAETEDMSYYERHLVSGSVDFKDIVHSHVKRSWVFFKRQGETRYGSVLIGQTLASRLRVRTGDTVHLISPFQSQGRSVLASHAESRPFIVRGIFKLGMSDFDAALALVDLPNAQALYHLDKRVTGISIRFLDVEDARKWQTLIAGHLGVRYAVRSWYDLNANFFQALKVEKSVMTILLALIILVAVFNILSTLIMVVMEKTKDIGTLRALGATRASIRKIFLYEGFGVGFLGVLFGAALGLFAALRLNQISDFIRDTTGLEVFPSDIYYFDKIPVEVHYQDVLLIVAFALVAAVFAGVLPAYRAAKLHPLEALRYE